MNIGKDTRGVIHLEMDALEFAILHNLLGTTSCAKDTPAAQTADSMYNMTADFVESDEAVRARVGEFQVLYEGPPPRIY